MRMYVLYIFMNALCNTCIVCLHFPLPFISKNVSFSHSRLYQHGLGVVVRIPILHALDCADLGESSLLKVAKVLLSTTPVCVDDWQARCPTLVDDVAATPKRIIIEMCGSNAWPY